VISLDASLVRGSHGRIPDSMNDGPVLISSEAGTLGEPLQPTAVRDIILAHVFGTGRIDA
jgi:hypothetical protein